MENFTYTTTDFGYDLFHSAPLGFGVGAALILASRTRVEDCGDADCTSKTGACTTAGRWDFKKIAINSALAVVALWGVTRWAKNTQGC